jgi:hypothetical protein
MKVPDALRALVRERANHACEYCRLPETASIVPHQVDHIVALQHMGTDEATNLCLCCIRCNLSKGPNIASIDPLAGADTIVPLFHPRRDHGATTSGSRRPGRSRVSLRRDAQPRASSISRQPSECNCVSR